MSNSLAIAAVTATLRNLVETGLGNEVSGAKVTTQPPDEVTAGNDLVNLFLYQTAINAAWRNMDNPQAVKPGETGQPALALNLYYLLTAYAKTNDAPNPVSHQLLGRAMRVLHDHPLLSAAEIKAAFPDNDLHEQIERVRITLQPMTLDEMSKLWTTFQTKYRISAAYQVSVVLIDSQRPSTTPLPVLTRGKDDRGVDAQASLLAPFPTLTELLLPAPAQPSAQLGNTMTLRGHHLDGDRIDARFNNTRLTDPMEIGPLTPPVSSGSADIALQIPDNPAARVTWVAGNYTVSLVVTRNTDPTNPIRTTNDLSFSVAPRILTVAPPSASAAAGDFDVTITCSPEVRPEQRVSLLFGAIEVKAGARLASTDSLTFRVAPVTPAMIGTYFVRLRVDGVDSMLVKYDVTPPIFDANQKVTITA